MIRALLRKAYYLTSAYPWAGIPYDPYTVSDEVYLHYHPAARIERWFYNIGAGSFRHKYWTNVDLASDWYADQQGTDFINYDLFSLKPLPIPSGIAEAVYTSHTVEHINDAACANLFAETFRILRPGGYFYYFAHCRLPFYFICQQRSFSSFPERHYC